MPSREARKPPSRSGRCWRPNGAWPPRCRCWSGIFSRRNAPRPWRSSAARREAGSGWRSPSPTCSRSPMPPVLRPTISRAPWALADFPALLQRLAPVQSRGFSLHPEQTNPRHLNSFRLRHKLLPWLDFSPDSFLDPLQLLLLSLLMTALVGPLLVTLGPALLGRPPRIGVPRLGDGVVCSGSLLVRHGLRGGSSGLLCLSGRLWRSCGVDRLRGCRSGIVCLRLRLRRNRRGRG